MWAAILRFCAYVVSKTWKYGAKKVKQIVAYAKKNYVKIYRMIISGIAWDTIIQWIINHM